MTDHSSDSSSGSSSSSLESLDHTGGDDHSQHSGTDGQSDHQGEIELQQEERNSIVGIDVLGASTANQRELQDLVMEIGAVVDRSLPSRCPMQTSEAQLRRLPPQVPVMITHDAISVILTMAQQLGVETREESAISAKQ